MSNVQDNSKGADPAAITHRRFKDGENMWTDWPDLSEKIFQQDKTYKCPTYVHRTAPCQGACPSGHDIRGWLAIARGMDKPADKDTKWQEYAFARMVEANPFPATMGRVCPAPCEDGCNRNEVDDFVGINAVEQYVGDWAGEKLLGLPQPGADTGRSVAVIGGGPAGLAVAYFLRRKGHAVTIFEAHAKLGGMMRYGIPGYRTPRDVLDREIQRILDMGVEVRTNTKIGVDISLEQLDADFDAVFVGIGAQSGTPIAIPGAREAVNCISGVAFLEAFNDGRLQHGAQKVLVIGGGDTAMDVAAVARRLGHITHSSEHDRPEYVVLGHTAHDVATVARRDGADVKVIYRRPIEKMPATEMEVKHVREEGVEILGSLVPIEVVMATPDRARALRVARADWSSGKMVIIEGSEHEIEADLIVAAIGQTGDFAGLEGMDAGRGLIATDALYRIKGREKHFAGGDILRPHLLTTAIGHGRIAAESIDQFLSGKPMDKRPKVDVHQFNLLEELQQRALEPVPYDGAPTRGTDEANFAIHNYDDRGTTHIVPHKALFKGHFKYEPRERRAEIEIGADAVLGHFGERIQGFTEAQAIAEGKRCMSCGLCFECDNCVVFCPQTAVKRYPKKERAVGHYVFTDYTKCIGCHICADVCPTGYIQMGLGE